MGNMIFNKRVSESLDENAEHRIFPSHMYTGPLKLGDPKYRGLSKMEQDPLIPERMKDIARTVHCIDYVAKFTECGKNEGSFRAIWACKQECKEMISCIEGVVADPEFKGAVIEEYLNERSHYRQTGIKTQRYKSKQLIKRDIKTNPPFDDEGKYIPLKPTGWDESYKDSGPPDWATFEYCHRWK